MTGGTTPAWRWLGDPTHPQVVLLHGFLGRGTDWADMVSAGRWHALVPDLPGHGDSAGLPEAEFTLPAAATGIARAMDAAGVKTADVVGYSLGGRVAAHLAVLQSDRVKRLALVSAHMGLPSMSERLARTANDADRAAELRTDFRAFVEKWGRQPLFAHLAESLRGKLRAERLAGESESLACALTGLSLGGQRPLAPALRAQRTIPVLAVSGSKDADYAARGRQLAHGAEHITASVIDGCGHNVPREAPGALAALLSDFLRTPPY